MTRSTDGWAVHPVGLSCAAAIVVALALPGCNGGGSASEPIRVDGDDGGDDDGDDDGDGDDGDDGDGGDDGDDGDGDGGDDGDDGDDGGTDDGMVDDGGDDGPGPPSAGCGKGPESFSHLSVVDAGQGIYRGQTGDGRVYEVDLHPAVLGTHGNATPMPLLLGVHGCGENIEASRFSLFRFIENGGGDASRPFIAVYPQSADQCWHDHPESGDHAYLTEMYGQIYEDLCIDTEGIFIAGQSSGGIETHSLGMYPIYGGLPGRTAAIAVNAGGLPYEAALPAPTSVMPTQFFGIHGTIDPVVSSDWGRSGRDYWLQANGCSGAQMPLDPLPNGCVWYDPGDPQQDQFDCECYAYEECSSDQPVYWCEHRWDIHYMPDWGPPTILEFFLDAYGY